MDQDSWNQFVLQHGPRSGRFLQSWEWGEFQKAVGEQMRREEFVEDGKIVGIAQWLAREVPGLGGYAFCPKGPIYATPPDLPLSRGGGLGFTPPDSGGARGGQMFLRIEPSDSDLPILARKSIDLNPAHTLITDLSASEEELTATMHPKTRYNIRVAQKHGVEVNLASRDFESVWHLFAQTSSRGQFRLHPKRYYETMLASLQNGDCRAFLATASYEGNLLAANVMIDFGDTRTYLHGASANEHRQHMAPYLLHWELMRDARARGLRWYDWWGVAPTGAGESHPWFGISRFKRGFGGEEVASPGTYDLVLKPWRYRLYQFARHVRRML